MNEDHREALNLYATRLAGEPAAEWRASGLDPEGIDLQAGDRTARVAFPHPVRDAAALRATLVALAAGRGPRRTDRGVARRWSPCRRGDST
jgi:putative heme iron utilization protein